MNFPAHGQGQRPALVLVVRMSRRAEGGQRRGEDGHVGVTLRRIPGDRGSANRVEARVEARDVGGRRRRIVVDNAIEQVALGGTVERSPAGQQLVQDHAEAVHVGGAAVRVGSVADPFGRQVSRRAERGRAEVGQDRLAAPVDEDVGRLEVAVEHAAIVGLLQGKRQGADQRRRLRGRQAPQAQPLRQRGPVDVGHRQKRRAVDDAGFVEGADVRMVQRRGGAGGPPKARGGIGPAVVQRNLQGDEPAQFRVVGQVNHAHAALAELHQDAVAPELFRRLPRPEGEIGHHDLSLVIRTARAHLAISRISWRAAL